MSAVSRTLDVNIPHQLGRAEARRRIAEGFARLDPAALGFQQITVDNQWHGDTLDLSLSAFGQQIRGTATVGEENVRVQVVLPWLLARLADKLRPQVKAQTERLLGK